MLPSCYLQLCYYVPLSGIECLQTKSWLETPKYYKIQNWCTSKPLLFFFFKFCEISEKYPKIKYMAVFFSIVPLPNKWEDWMVIFYAMDIYISYKIYIYIYIYICKYKHISVSISAKYRLNLTKIENWINQYSTDI